ncbi:hypothetical protein SMICM304S_07784 [Streptomyces microflavus]
MRSACSASSAAYRSVRSASSVSYRSVCSATSVAWATVSAASSVACASFSAVTSSEWLVVSSATTDVCWAESSSYGLRSVKVITAPTSWSPSRTGAVVRSTGTWAPLLRTRAPGRGTAVLAPGLEGVGER